MVSCLWQGQYILESKMLELRYYEVCDGEGGEKSICSEAWEEAGPSSGMLPY